MKRLALALLILSLAVTGAVAKQTCKQRADEKKLAGAMRSPDLADAFLLTFACGEKRKERYRKPEPRNYSAWAV